jgi:hypothetical protein
MPQKWIEKLSMRGEQLTLALLKQYLPDLPIQNPINSCVRPAITALPIRAVSAMPRFTNPG